MPDLFYHRSSPPGTKVRSVIEGISPEVRLRAHGQVSAVQLMPCAAVRRRRSDAARVRTNPDLPISVPARCPARLVLPLELIPTNDAVPARDVGAKFTATNSEGASYPGTPEGLKLWVTTWRLCSGVHRS